MIKRFLFITLFLLTPFSAFSKDWDPRLLDAVKLAYQGKIETAESTIESYIQENPEDPNGLFVKGVIWEWKMPLRGLDEKKENPKILSLYKQASDMAFFQWDKDQDNVDKLINVGNGYVFLARKYSDVGSWFKAVLTGKKCQQHLEKALKLDPTRVDGLVSLGGFHYLADNVPEGAKAFRGILGIKGDKNLGLNEIRQSFSKPHPYSLNGQFLLLSLYEDYEKNYDEALKTLSFFETQFPENPEFKYKKGRILQKKDPNLGIPVLISFADWCSLNAKNCHSNYLFLSYFLAAKNYKILNNPSKAREMLTKAISNDSKLDPNKSAEALLWIAQLDQAEGKNPIALEQLERAKSIQDASKKVKKEIEDTKNQICSAEKIEGKC
ncbi:MAG: hypothetical protein JNK65_07465 [Deltaproteobacteria bacterium]|nr:hypothetical protein [Deltaproteobacteria bacterium]